MTNIPVDNVRYHDFHLRGYSVSEGGERITLDLLYDYPQDEQVRSLITFTGVTCYSFVHTHGAIITNIFERPIPELVAEEAAFFTENSKLYGVRLWDSDLDHYIAKLHQNGLHAWEIISAMGFFGFVIATAMDGQVVPNPGPTTPTRTESTA